MYMLRFKKYWNFDYSKARISTEEANGVAYPKMDWSGRSRQDGGTAHEVGAWRQRRQPGPSWAASPSAVARPPAAWAAAAAGAGGCSPPLDQEPGTLAPIRLLHIKERGESGTFSPKLQ